MQGVETTSAQLRAARSAIGWTVRDLATRSGVGEATIKRYEAASGIPKNRKGNLEALTKAYEAAGIEFIGTPEDAQAFAFTPPNPNPANQ